MTRQEIMDSYVVDARLTIRTSGKFEAESAWAPYFWDETGNGCCDTLDYPDGTTIYVTTIDEADRAQWPEIGADIVAALLEEADSGFVACELVTQDELNSREADCEAQNEAESDDEAESDTETLMACDDCLFYVANGDAPDDRDIEADIQANLGHASGRLACGDSDKSDEFSHSACECCGSPLGGARHQIVVMPEA